ncbi:MAG: hypothetical protein IT460_14975 [Planctomycetes bacterium]|nr:hypothetical protein [Planctomycetota bacterium]
MARRTVLPAWSAAFLVLALAAGATRVVSAEDAKPAEPAKPDAPADPNAKPADPNANGGAKPEEHLVHGRPNPFHGEPVLLKDGLAEAVRLKGYLKTSKSDNGDILASLDALAKAYHNLAPNDDAGKATFEADREKFQKEAEKLFIDALEVKRVKPNTSANDRDDVNIRAAQVLATCRKEVTSKIIEVLETKVFKAKDYDPPTTLYDEAFKAIGIVNDHKVGLPYCLDWVKYSNNKGDPERIKAAYDAMVEFRDVKGSVRLEFVDKTLRTFLSVETAADRGRTKEEQSQKAVWDKIKTAVVKALQAYCKEPKAKDGALMAKLKDFDQWFRDNDSPKNPVWDDPKIAHVGK